VEKYYLTNKVAEIRKIRGWSQKEFVEFLSMKIQAEVEYVTYGHWERGDRSVSATVAMAVAKLLDVSIKEIARLG
jgi:transcriptional regulator with XRE-family HTH domain